MNLIFKCLSIVLAFYFVPVSVSAYDAYIDGIYYRFNNNEAEVTFCYQYDDDYYEGYLNANAYIGNVIIPSSVSYNGQKYSVTKIGFEAFEECSKLTSVVIPNSVKSIGAQAFYGCTSLSSISIPASVTSIDSRAFEGCSNLRKAEFYGEIINFGEYPFPNSNINTLIIHGSCTNIGEVSRYMTQINDVYNYSITPQDINSYTFSSYGTLHVKSGCTETYKGTEYWENFTIVEDFINITASCAHEQEGSVSGGGEYHTGGQVTLTALRKPGYLFKQWSDGSTANPYIFTATEDKELTAEFIVGDIDSGLKWTIENGVFTYSGNSVMRIYTRPADVPWNSHRSEIKTVIISEGVQSVANYAFYNCTNLSSVTLPNSITSIGNDAFENCSSMTSISIPDNVTSLGTSAFSRCTGLTSVTIPNNITFINTNSFSDCTGLTSVTIGNKVTGIGSSAFVNCTKLYEVFNLSNLNLEIGSENYGKVAYYAKAIHKSFDEPSIYHREGDFLFWGTENPCLTAYVGTDKDITLPNDCRGNNYTIDNYAFQNYNNLESVTIPDGTVTAIGYYAFKNCTKLVSISLPNSINTIDYGAFESCSNLSTVELPNGLQAIADKIFLGCSSLVSVTLPKTVKNIFTNAFYGCNNLQSVTCLAIEPPTIYSWAFSTYGTLHVLPGCKSSYQTADYWKNFTIVEDAVDPSPRTITLGEADYATYCSDANLDFTNVDGLKAYIASAFNPSTHALTITRVNTVPAGEGFLLKGTANQSYNVPTTTESNVVANLMKGCTESTSLSPTSGNYTNFVLSKNGENEMGFYPFIESVSISTNNAWLQIPTSAIGMDSNSNGIILIEAEDEQTNSCYDVNQDGGVTIEDVTKIIDFILGK